MPSADEKCPDNRRATVTGRWFGGCAGSEVCCAPNDEPATVLYAPRAAWFVNRTIRAFAATHACPDPQPVVRCSARARRRREPRKPGRTRSAAPDSFRNFTSIAPRRTHSAPPTQYSSVPLDEVKLLYTRGGPTCLVIFSAPPKRRGAPLPALRSTPRPPNTDRRCL